MSERNTRTAVYIALSFLSGRQDQTACAKPAGEQTDANERRVPKQSIETRLAEQRVDQDEHHERREQPDRDARHEGAENVDLSEHPRPPATAAEPRAGLSE